MRSLLGRGAPLASPEAQRARLDALGGPRFDAQLHRAPLEILQLNLGKRCNMSCRHCHVDAGPDREEVMSPETIAAALALLDASTAHTVDITGGAPELHPGFRALVDACVARGKHVMDRCNLTILTLPAYADLPAWLGERGVEVVASLPHWRRLNTDAQRGEGTFERSIEALRRLNAAGYGAGDPRRRLTLVHNPAGAFLPGRQAALEKEWREGLARQHGVAFDRLIALNNMPISRFLEWLDASGNLEGYHQLLVSSFNPAALAGVMCRNTLSVSWDGRLYDCDFNQMLAIDAALPPLEALVAQPLPSLEGAPIRTHQHCFGCTAGAGSSCGGAVT